MRWIYLILLLILSIKDSYTAILSNIRLPVDTNGNEIVTGEASVLKRDSLYYFYFNDWGDCPGIDCCNSTEGCASCCFNENPIKNCSNPYLNDHVVRAYATDFVRWIDLGIVLSLENRLPGIEFRPCVVYNALTDTYVMWYEDRAPGEIGYAVATSKDPAGPFQTIRTNVTMPGDGKIGDFNIFVDDDGCAYHVRTGFDLVLLDENYTGPERWIASFDPPKRSEGPTMFKRSGVYYITAGTDCCACLGGSSIYIYRSDALEGPWDFRGDVGSNPTPFDPHSPANYVTKAQGSAIFHTSDSVVWLGNQWNSGLSQSPPGPRNHDLLYWAPFSFNSEGDIDQLSYHEHVIISP